MKKQNGFSMIEMMVSLGLAGIATMIVYNIYEFSQKETRILSEDIINTIARFGASRVLTYDLLSAEPSFNYVNMADDNERPFFALAKNEFCRSEKCKRKLTLEITRGQTKSKSFYIIVKRPQGKESLKFSIEPDSVYGADKQYSAINWRKTDVNFSISKSSDRPDSPWQKERLLMLTSEMDFYDCNAPVMSMSGGSCMITCPDPGKCNFVTKRPFRMLGAVNADELDMSFYKIEGAPSNILKTSYDICRPDKNNNCLGRIDLTSGLTSTRLFYEKLPYIPGNDNRTSLAPVEVVKYWLERPNAQSGDHMIQLMRSKATFVGGKIEFQKPIILMNGLQSIVFSRVNISNPIIEYKLKKVRMKKSLNK